MLEHEVSARRTIVSYVINNNDAMCTTVVRRCDSPETFLT
jgi:hypothetical protein